MDDAGRDIQLFGHECVHAEPRVVNFPAHRFVAIETRQAGGCGIQVYARSRSDVDRTIVAKTTKTLQE